MRPTRRTFMQSVTAFFAGLFGAAKAEEIVDQLKPRKVMVPGVDFDLIRKPTQEEVQRYAPYRTPKDRYNPKVNALHQELFVGEPGYWRTGNYMGREGVTYGALRAENKVPIGCQLGPNARLIYVDEAAKTLKFELAAESFGEWNRRALMATRKAPPPRAIVHMAYLEPHHIVGGSSAPEELAPIGPLMPWYELPKEFDRPVDDVESALRESLESILKARYMPKL